MVTRLAFISDLHSNWEALQAVAPSLLGLPTYCCGDLVGYGANPCEVLDWVRSHKIRSVMGNHDEAVVTGETGWFNPLAAQAITWTRSKLRADQVTFLEALPRALRFEAEGSRFLIVHGSPEDPIHEYVYPQTHRDLFDYYLEKHAADVLVLGHTHVPFIAKVERGVVFNPGSVGQPRHGEPGAFFAVVSVDRKAVDVKLMRATYEISAAVRKIFDAGLPRALGERLYEGL